LDTGGCVPVLWGSVRRVLALAQDALLRVGALIRHHVMVHIAHSIVVVRIRVVAHWEVTCLAHHIRHVLHLLRIEARHVGLVAFEVVGTAVIEIELAHILHIR
jgi:hypothetical protein